MSALKEDECQIVCDDMNGHLGKEVDGFDKVLGGHGFGSKNLEGEIVSEFADAMDLDC